MATPDPADLTPEEFQAIARRAGLDLTDAELEHLLPMYQNLRKQIDKLHDPALPLGGPADTFHAQWDSR